MVCHCLENPHGLLVGDFPLHVVTGRHRGVNGESSIGESVIRQMFITDTIEPFQDPLPENITIISVAVLFAKAIRSIHDRTSVSMLFPEPKRTWKTKNPGG